MIRPTTKKLNRSGSESELKEEAKKKCFEFFLSFDSSKIIWVN